MPDEFHAGKSSPPSGIEAKYANYFQVGHNAFEFLLDCGQFYSDGRREHFHTRIVTSPRYAKELLKVLRDAVEQYEENFGPIQQHE
jgi:hypothetical protein